MTTAKIKRSQVATFLNTTPSSTATYARLGDGVSSGTIEYNPKVTEETYVHEDNATKTIDSYAPVMSIEATAVNGDAVFEFIDALRIARAVLDDAETDIVEVRMYETGGPTAYPAEKQNVAIQIDSFGGDGGTATKINYTINYIGDPVVGTFNASTSAFTAS
jgi:hypothetical protein